MVRLEVDAHGVFHVELARVESVSVITGAFGLSEVLAYPLDGQVAAPTTSRLSVVLQFGAPPYGHGRRLLIYGLLLARTSSDKNIKRPRKNVVK